MKALFIANGVGGGKNPGLTGGETRFIEIARAWANRDVEIHLLSSMGGKTICDNLGLTVRMHPFTSSNSSSRFTIIRRLLKSIFFIPKSLKTFNEGIIYSTNEMLLDVFPALRLKFKYGNRIKWVVVVHWLPPSPPWKRKKSTILNSTLFFINERLSLWLANWFADILLPVSQMTMDQLRVAGIRMSKVQWVECGVNYKAIRAIADDVDKKKYDGVYMKRLHAVKGIFDLINIWEEVVRMRPNAKLLVMGEGVDGERAREIVKIKGLDKNIEFAGMVYVFKEKFEKIVQGQLFILPTYEENWAIVVGEAMAAGTPVIAYDLKEMVDVWDDAVIWIPTGDKIAFAKKIIELLDMPEILSALSIKGIEYVKKYDWEVIAERELNLILGKK